jgi:RND family efflux transporter MFP subunit
MIAGTQESRGPRARALRAVAWVALAAGCGGADPTAAGAVAAPAPLVVEAVPVATRTVARRLRVAGSLMADEQAEVSAEIAGRVVATPVERGVRVAAGAALARLSSTEADAQLGEAEANAAQIAARLGASGTADAADAVDVDRVPEVRNARAMLDLAEAEFGRIQTLLEERVVSRSEFDQRRAQVEAARQQVEVARNAAAQQVQAWRAARARILLARKAVDDTVVRAPFGGLVGERRVSVGDFVTRGTVVATVMRVDPLRVELTVPEQAMSRIRAGQTVVVSVDAYPGRTFDALVRFVSPALRADQRALTVEAVLANPDGLLKPGLFASAEIETPGDEPVPVVPAAAVQTVGGMSRLFVVRGDRAEERIVAIGQTIGALVEIADGVSPDDLVVVTRSPQLADGTRIQVN